MARRRRVATEAEKALWSAVVRDVRPLDGSPTWEQPDAPEPLPPQVPETRLVSATPAPSAPGPGPGPVDRATLGRLKRGQVSVDARIDLHGMDQRAAFSALMGFIEVALRTEKRIVLVITGKGSSDTGGILRRSTPGWLTSSPFGPRILAITPAHVRHGGEGALYVMLRRKPTRAR